MKEPVAREPGRSVRFSAAIGSRQIAVEMTRRGDRAEGTLDGRPFTVQARRRGDAWLIEPATSRPGASGRRKDAGATKNPPATKSPPATVEAFVVPLAGRRDACTVLLRGRTYGVVLEQPQRAASGAAGGPARPGRAEIRSVMPGKVRALLVKEGDEVKAGQGLVVIEAMKMENEIPSPKDGRVAAIGVRPGDTVEAGTLLCRVE